MWTAPNTSSAPSCSMAIPAFPSYPSHEAAGRVTQGCWEDLSNPQDMGLEAQQALRYVSATSLANSGPHIAPG